MRAIRYTGRRTKPFAVDTERGPVEVTPGQVMAIEPGLASALLREHRDEFEPAPRTELPKEER